jgi:hypothetical protein
MGMNLRTYIPRLVVHCTHETAAIFGPHVLLTEHDLRRVAADTPRRFVEFFACVTDCTE